MSSRLRLILLGLVFGLISLLYFSNFNFGEAVSANQFVLNGLIVPPDNSQITTTQVATTQIATAQITRTATYNGLPVGFTEEGYPYLGNPTAQVTLSEFSDYLCPFCGRHFTQTAPLLLKEYGDTGLVRFVYREFPIAQLHPTAHHGSIAALCAGQQAPEHFWAMHDELFERQSEWNQLPDPNGFLRDVAQELQLDLTVYERCIASDKMQEVVDQGNAEAKALGLTGTPSFAFTTVRKDDVYTLVGAQSIDVFRQWLDALLAGDEPPIDPEPEKPELPFWANEDGLKPDPDRAGYTVAGDPFKGSIDAPIVVVEFSDFQCPACARHSNEVQPTLDATFVYSDTVRWVFKHLPLREHEFAPVSAVAAECAADQGAFWEMHDLLFATVDQWAGTEPETTSVLDSFELIFSANKENNESEEGTQEGAAIDSEKDSGKDGKSVMANKREDNADKMAARKIDDVENELIALAETLDLDVDIFTACLTSRRALERVLFDIYDAQGVVQQTPTFVILFDGQGSVLRGARDAEQFVDTLQGFIERSAAQAE